MMSSVIVDTHIIIWDRLAPDKLSAKARRAITEADHKHQLVICEISFWEIAMLVRKKRIEPDMPFLDMMTDILDSRNYILQGITPEIALVATEMSLDTKDPADRIIAATALKLDMPLISADQFMLKSTDIKTIW